MGPEGVVRTAAIRGGFRAGFVRPTGARAPATHTIRRISPVGRAALHPGDPGEGPRRRALLLRGRPCGGGLDPAAADGEDQPAAEQQQRGSEPELEREVVRARVREAGTGSRTVLARGGPRRALLLAVA